MQFHIPVVQTINYFAFFKFSAVSIIKGEKQSKAQA